MHALYTSYINIIVLYIIYSHVLQLCIYDNTTMVDKFPILGK